MKRRATKTILASREPSSFVGRNAELDRLMAHASGGSIEAGLAILATPGAGTTELLRQVYDRLFTGQADITPFYFEIKDADKTAFACACRFAREFLTQAVAFRRRDPSIIAKGPDLDELSRIAHPADIGWVDHIIETTRSADGTSTCPAGLRSLLSAPLRTDVPVFLMIDGAQHSAAFGELFDELIDTLSRSDKRWLVAGARRFLFARTPVQSVTLERLSGAHLAEITSSTAASHRVRINDSSRDLIGVQTAGDVRLIRHIFAAAAASGQDLDSFESVQRVYTDEIFGGRISRHFDLVFERSVREAEIRDRVITVLAENVENGKTPIPLEYWRRRTSLDSELSAVMQDLNSLELIDLFPGSTRLNEENITFHDYLNARLSLERGDVTRAQAVGETLADNMTRAPKMMGASYRKQAAIRLSDLLASFKGQHVPEALFDYSRFKTELKGVDQGDIQDTLISDDRRISLPNIAYTAAATTFYPQLRTLIEAERTSVGIGFDAGDKERITWIAAEIDSKLEATRELTEFWCDRLEMVANACELSPFTIWLVAPEGFEPDALDALRGRNAYGSSRRQVELLGATLGSTATPTDTSAAKGNEYEFVIPMGAETEMIAARAIEDVARRHNIPSKAINQIKTALVEACINATEHSLSPDSKISLKATVEEGQMTLMISNRGVRLADKKSLAPTDEARRGWGLKLIQGLMDEVTHDETDDGTIIRMTKKF